MTDPSLQIREVCRGLPPVTGPEPLLLILGSFPSVLSLAHREYYGNPKNRFWPVIEELFAIPAALPYPERILHLTRKRVALWDVIRGCIREGSADSRIRDPIPNDIPGFVQEHPTTRLIVLNGRTAGRMYHRFAEVPGIPFVILPSTSPANAAMTFKEKVHRWEIVKTTFVRT